MQHEGHQFRDVRGLVAAARASVRDGRFRSVGRDGEEPALLWLDRLALQRTDWHDALAQTWAELLTDDDAEVRAAAVDALDCGATTPLFVPALDGVRDAEQAVSTALQALRPDAPPLTLQAVLGKHRSHHNRWVTWPTLVIVRVPALEVVRLAESSDVLALARRSAAQGGSITGGSAAGHFALDWLRTLALGADWARALVGPTLAALLQGDAREVAAAVEYAVRSGDRAAVAPTFRLAADRDTALASSPVTTPLAPAKTLAALARWLQDEAATEVASAPASSVAEA